MDKLTACRILGVAENAGRKEIREAYAALSKKYHPEENPDEFQQIHEAYLTLTRRMRSENGPVNADTPYREPEPRKHAGNREVRTEDLDFDAAVGAAQQKEQERLHETVLKAAAEMRVLLEPQYKYKLRLFKEFFKKEEYQTALKTSEFMESFAEELKKTELKGIIYDYIIDYYRLKSADRRQMHRGAGMLYDLLDQRRGIMKKRIGPQFYAIPTGVLIAVRIVVRNGYRQSEAVGVLVWCVLALIGLVWSGKKLYENHSGIFSQFIVALILSAAQFFAVMFDFYAPLFGVDGGAVAAVLVMLAGIIWMIALAFAAVLSKLRNMSIRK